MTKSDDAKNYEENVWLKPDAGKFSEFCELVQQQADAETYHLLRMSFPMFQFIAVRR